MRHFKIIIPWWLRIASKIVLSRLPINYRLWKTFRLFEHGDMNLPERALKTFLMHAGTVGALDSSGKKFNRDIASDSEFNVLELGPGDSLFGGLIAYSLGASRTWLVDTGNYATIDPKSYGSMIDYLFNRSYLHSKLNISSFDDFLSLTHTTYLTEGVSSLKNIPDKSIDFCFSNAVLEHVNSSELYLLIMELKRILKRSSLSCHRVDLKDHLGGGLNNLRFSRRRWESQLFKETLN